MIIHGDCLEELKKLEDNSVDAIVTDPPYGLSFMGKKWDYDVPSIEVWQECLRVLKPGGYLLAFAGTRTQHRMAVRIEDAGFEIRDMIAWVYGSGFPKSLNIGKAIQKIQGIDLEIIGENPNHRPNSPKDNSKGDFNPKSEGNKYLKSVTTPEAKEWEGWGTALKPALEPITVARKPISEKTVAENCLKWGVGGINIDECRVEAGPDHIKNATRHTNKIYRGGFNDSPINSDASPLGRFPANLLHDGSDEVVSLFPNTKPTKPHGGDGGKLDTQNMGRGFKRMPCELSDNGGSASRFFMTCKYTPNDAIMKLCENNINANNAELSLPITNLIEAVVNIYSVLKSATPNIDLLNQNLNALFAEKIPKNTVIDFVAKLVATSEVPEVLLSQQELQATQDFIINYKNSTQTQNLASAEKLENTDITQITINLLKLCGFVVLVIDENTNSDTKEKAEQKLEPKRFAYIPKASKSERNRGCEHLEEKDARKFDGGDFVSSTGKSKKDTVARNNHPTVKPIALMEYLVKLVSREGAVVLDPFAGSGTTGLACKNLNRKYILIEREEDYIKIIKARLDLQNQQT